MKKHRRPTQKDAAGIAKLSEYQIVLRQSLTIPTPALIKRINEGHTQSMIAREFGTSRSAVSQRIKTLRARGLLSLTQPTGGGKKPIYDVHLGSLIYPLSKPVKLPFDAKGKSQTLTWQEWSVKGHRIRQNIGKDGTSSLEIFGLRYSGDTLEELNNSLMDDCRGLYDWLCVHFPELETASSARNFRINRPGKLTIHALKGTAEAALKTRGGGQIILDNVGMIDDSLKNGGEFHIFLSFMKNLATKEDIGKLTFEMSETRKAIIDLLELIKGKPEQPKEPAPPELDKNDSMFR